MGESAPLLPDDGVGSCNMASRVVATRYMELVMKAWNGEMVIFSKGTEMGTVETPGNLNPEYLGNPCAKEITKIIRIKI